MTRAAATVAVAVTAVGAAAVVASGRQAEGLLVEASAVHGSSAAGAGTAGVTIAIRDGRVAAIGAAAPRDFRAARTLKAAAVSPGLIDARTTLGLASVQSHDDDDNETSAPNQAPLRAVDAYNLREPRLRAALADGVTFVHAGPGRANPIGGLSGVFRTAAPTTEAATIRFPASLVVSLTEAAKTTYAARDRLNTRMATVGLLRQAFIDARQYVRRRAEAKPPERDLRLEALSEAAAGRVPTVVSAERLDEVATALRLGDEFGLRLMIAGASDAGLIVDRLARAGLPVLVGPPDEAPAEGGDETTRRSLPARLHAAGVPFALVSGDGAGAVRESLRLRAARAVAEGLPREAAIAAITTTPARILGLDDRYGLAVGRSADLVLYDGDPLAYATRVIAVIAAGEVVFEHADRRP